MALANEREVIFGAIFIPFFILACVACWISHQKGTKHRERRILTTRFDRSRQRRCKKPRPATEASALVALSLLCRITWFWFAPRTGDDDFSVTTTLFRTLSRASMALQFSALLVVVHFWASALRAYVQFDPHRLSCSLIAAHGSLRARHMAIQRRLLRPNVCVFAQCWCGQLLSQPSSCDLKVRANGRHSITPLSCSYIHTQSCTPTTC